MKRLGWAVGAALIAGVVAALLSAGAARGDQFLRQGFEGREPVWVQGPADAPYKVLAHRITDDHAMGGQRSEFLQFQAEAGTYIHYTYDVGRAPVTEDLTVSLWVRANRPRIQLLARVVLPHERDPRNPEVPLTTFIHGDPERDAYKLVGRWEHLSLRLPVKRLQEKERLLRAELKRDVNAADAYVDRVVLNVYSGPGLTEVWTDDLEVGPVVEGRPAPPEADAKGRGPTARPAVGRRPSEVQLRGNQLLVGGEKFFLLGIRHTGTPLSVLKEAGFNTLWLDESAPPGLIDEAVAREFMVVPAVSTPGLADRPGGPIEGRLTSTDVLGQTVSRFLGQDRVLCWDLGGNLTAEQFPRFAKAARNLQTLDPMRPLAVDVWDGFRTYSTNGDQPLLLGVHRWPLMTTLELPGFRDWLTARRKLAAPDTFCWTWVQTHLPDWFTTLAYEKPGAAGFQEPVGPQAEQIRLLAYTAVGSGFRGLGFWSDRFLADSHTGRDRLLALALLNLEFKMLEPLLTTAKRGEPLWVDTSHPEVKAAVIRCERGLLVLPVWLGKGGQFVPGQSAVAQLSLKVPMVPDNWVPWEVSPGRVQTVKYKKATSTAELTLHEFDLTTAIVFSADRDLWVHFQNYHQEKRVKAAQWAYDQAAEEFAKVEKVQAELDQIGQSLKDGKPLLDKARDYLVSSDQHRKNREFADAYADAQRALRPLRILMRAQWERAVRVIDRDNPVASPYALAFYTLPRHWQLIEQLREARAGADVLSGGAFEQSGESVPPGWLVQEAPTLDPVEAEVRVVGDIKNEGNHCVRLDIKPKEGVPAPPLALERTFLAVHSPSVHLSPGTWVRISASVRIPGPITATSDGALIYDSAGGEPLAVRLTAPTEWKQYTFYRKVPASGEVKVTLALTGIGRVLFDNVRIEPLGGKEPVEAAPERTAGVRPGGAP
jgi:hypothetical protein